LYGLPDDFDVTFFVGRRLEMVCFNENQVYLHFDRRVSLVIESSFEYCFDGQERSVDSMPVRSSDLMSLLGATVVRASATTDGTLSLELEGGRRITCFDTSTAYESYQIKNEDQITIV